MTRIKNNVAGTPRITIVLSVQAPVTALMREGDYNLAQSSSNLINLLLSQLPGRQKLSRLSQKRPLTSLKSDVTEELSASILWFQACVQIQTLCIDTDKTTITNTIIGKCSLRLHFCSVNDWSTISPILNFIYPKINQIYLYNVFYIMKIVQWYKNKEKFFLNFFENFNHLVLWVVRHLLSDN